MVHTLHILEQIAESESKNTRVAPLTEWLKNFWRVLMAWHERVKLFNDSCLDLLSNWISLERKISSFASHFSILRSSIFVRQKSASHLLLLLLPLLFSHHYQTTEAFSKKCQWLFSTMLVFSHCTDSNLNAINIISWNKISWNSISKGLPVLFAPRENKVMGWEENA